MQLDPMAGITMKTKYDKKFPKKLDPDERGDT